MLLCRKTFETTENYIGLQNEQNDELRHKTFKTTQNNESDQITMNLHRFDVQTIKNVELPRKPFKTAKLQKWSKYNDFHRFDVKNFKTTQNNESDQITMNLHRFDVQTIKNVELRRKPFKTAKLQKWSKYNDFHRFDVKNFKTNQNNESDQITMNLHRFDVQTIKNVELRRKPLKTAKLQKWSKSNDLHRFDVKTIKATQNSKRDQITMNLHRFDVHTIKNVELRRKPFKTAKLQKWSKYNDLHRFDVKSNHITMNLHRFDVKTIYNVEVSRKTF